jgi:hypothetical protein
VYKGKNTELQGTTTISVAVKHIGKLHVVTVWHEGDETTHRCPKTASGDLVAKMINKLFEGGMFAAIATLEE